MNAPRAAIRMLLAALLLAFAPRAGAASEHGGFADAETRAAAEDLGRRYVGAVNAPEAAVRAAVVREIFAATTLGEIGEARLVGQLDRLRGEFGALTFHHAEAFAHGEGAARRAVVHAYARGARDGRWRDLQFFLDPAPPHLLAQLVFVAEVAEPIYLPNGEITQPATLEWLGGYVDKLVADEDLAGGLVITVGDDVIFERVFGYADAARTRRIGRDARFSLASGGKMFTALALAGLAEEGRVEFAMPIARYLPALAGHTFAQRVTVAQLLSHTSGIGEYWTKDYEAKRGAIRTLAEYLPFILAAGTPSAPGERYAYSNSNFILAGLILEAVTGRPYADVVAERVFAPLGMSRTGLDPLDTGDSTLAQPLARDSTGWKPAPHGGRGSSAGGALSTLDDVRAFSRGLLAGRIVSDSMRTAMTTPQSAGDGGSDYGFGFELGGRGPATRWFGHGGIAGGMNFEYRHFPASGVTLIAYSNQNNGAYDDLKKNAIRLITGER